jgi:single-strand DNA-binding protein
LSEFGRLLGITSNKGASYLIFHRHPQQRTWENNMSASLNRVMIVGRLGQDPELRYTPSRVALTHLNVATHHSYVDSEGRNQDATEWHRVVVWNKQAETCAKYLQKGRQVMIEGRLQTRHWEDSQGIKRSSTEIVAQQVLFLGSPSQSSSERSEPLIEASAKEQQASILAPAAADEQASASMLKAEAVKTKRQRGPKSGVDLSSQPSPFRPSLEENAFEEIPF